MAKSTKVIQPIGNVDKIQQIIEALQSHIIDGKLTHGTELPSERELAEQLGVSRFSLREALRVAQAQGLLEISRGRRPRVAAPSAGAAAEVIALTLRRSKNKLLDLVAARQGIESQIARFAAMNASDADIEALEKTIEIIDANRSDPVTCVEQDIEFHNILVRASENLVFEIMLAPLAQLLRESRLETIRKGVDHVIVGHKAVLEAVRERDPEQAARAMHNHLDLAEADLRQLLAEKKKPHRKKR